MFVLSSESVDVWLSDVAVDAVVSPQNTHYAAVVVKAYKEHYYQHICVQVYQVYDTGSFVELFPCLLSAISSAPTGASAAVELFQP